MNLAIGKAVVVPNLEIGYAHAHQHVGKGVQRAGDKFRNGLRGAAHAKFRKGTNCSSRTLW